MNIKKMNKVYRNNKKDIEKGKNSIYIPSKK